MKTILTFFFAAQMMLFISAAGFGQYFPNNMTEAEYLQLKADVASGLIEEPVLFPSNGSGSRQGGDTPASATVIPSLPYNNSGTTIGFVDDVNSGCGNPLNGPDVFYSFTPVVARSIQVVTCGAGTNYDSKLAAFQNNVANCVAYNDDDFSCAFSGLHSKIIFDVCPGETYYIMVDGFGGASGNYDIIITDLGPANSLCGNPFAGLYGSTGAVGASLIGINPTNAISMLISALGSFGSVTEIQSDPTGTFLYGTTGGGTSNLIVIDPVTGSEALVANHQYGALNGLEFVGDILYGTYIPNAQLPSTLVMVDPVTAAFTPVGLTGRGPIAGLAYDHTSGIMYGISAENNLPAQLLTIDLNTGLASVVGPIGVALQCRGLVFGLDGTLYTGTSTTDQLPGFLISVDKSTGAGTIIGPTGYSGISGLALLSPVQNVPISNWAIGIGIFLIIAATFIRMRRLS